MTLADEAAAALWREITAALDRQELSDLGTLVTLHEFVLDHEAAVLNAWAGLGPRCVGYSNLKRHLEQEIWDARKDSATIRSAVIKADKIKQAMDGAATRFDAFSLSPPANILVLLQALEKALSRAWRWDSPASGRSGQGIAGWTAPAIGAARSLRGTDYQVCRRYRRAPNIGHSLEDLPWLDVVSILPQRLDGAQLQVYALQMRGSPEATRSDPREHPNGQENGGAASEPVRIAVWPISRDLGMQAQYAGTIAHPLRSGSASDEDEHGLYRFRPEADLMNKPVAGRAEVVLDACAQKRVDVLMIPELTSSLDFVSAIQSLLRQRYDAHPENRSAGLFPWLIVCGSYHHDDQTPDSFSSFHNRCVVLSGDGEKATITPLDSTRPDIGCQHWLVDKRHQFKLRRDMVEAAHRRDFGLDRHRVSLEPSRVAERILVVDTPIGRVWVTICLDFLKTAGRTVLPRFAGLADWILVPAATRSTSEFEWRAKDIANTSGTASVMANACWLVERFGAWDKARAGLAYSPRDDGGKTVVKWERASNATSTGPGAVLPQLLKQAVGKQADDAPDGGGTVRVHRRCDDQCAECLWIAEIGSRA